MNSLTVSVPDPAMSAEVDAWTDGAEYTLRVRQDAPGQFTALEALPAEPMEPEVEPEAEPEAAPVAGAGAGAKPKGNPAIAVLIKSGRR